MTDMEDMVREMERKKVAIERKKQHWRHPSTSQRAHQD